MTVKYSCPKCNRRFADWGAQKMGFKCPHDENCPPGTEDEEITLLRVGAPVEDADAPQKPTLKRKKAKPIKVVQESELLSDSEDLEVVDELDTEDIEDDTEDEDEEEEVVVGAKKTVSTDSSPEDDDLTEEDGDDVDFDGDVDDASDDFEDLSDD
jgi:hypothetical protein